MRFKIFADTEVRALPEAVREYMERRFSLRPEYIHALRCVEYDAEFHDEIVRRVRIFDPGSAKRAGVAVRTGVDLQLHPELLLFEGYIDSLGRVYIADRRLPVRRDKALLGAAPFSAEGGAGDANFQRGQGAMHSVLARILFREHHRGGGMGADPCHYPADDAVEKARAEPDDQPLPRRKLGSYGPGGGWPTSSRHPDGWS